MEPVFFDTRTPHSPQVFCRRVVSPVYFFSYFETDFRYELEGELRSGSAGSMLIMEPGVPIYHGPAADSAQGFVNDWIYLDSPELSELLAKYPLPLNTPFSVGNENILRPYIEAIRKEKSIRSPGYTDNVFFLTGQMIIGLFRLCRSNLPGTDAVRQLEKVRNAMLAEPHKPWTLGKRPRKAVIPSAGFAAFTKKPLAVPSNRICWPPESSRQPICCNTPTAPSPRSPQPVAFSPSSIFPNTSKQLPA